MSTKFPSLSPIAKEKKGCVKINEEAGNRLNDEQFPSGTRIKRGCIVTF